MKLLVSELTNAAVWFNKICKIKRLTPKYMQIKFMEIIARVLKILKSTIS